MKTISRLFSLTRRYWWCFVIVGVCTVFQIIAQLVTPGIIRVVLAEIEAGSDTLANTAVVSAVMLIVFYLVQAVSQGMKSYFGHVAAWRSIHDIRLKLYNHIQNLSMKFFQDKQTGQIMSQILSDTNLLELLIAHAGPEIVLDVLLFCSVMIVLFISNAKLALVALIIVPFIAVSTRYFAKKIRPQFKFAHKKTADLMAMVQDDLSGIKEIQVFNRQNYEFNRVSKVSKEFTDLNLSALKKSAVFHPMISFFNQFGTALIIGFGGCFAAKYGLMGSEITAFILYLNLLYTPISSFARINEDLQNSLAAGERVLELFDTESDVTECENPIVPDKIYGEIEFDDVSFGYTDSEDTLKNISLKINKGETVALVGPTGGGKTTISNLITRFYDVSDGKVLIDGYNIKDLSLKALRDNISIVLQDVFLFHGTIAENIAYGAEDASFEDIQRAAKIANAHNFIIETENGYDTIIGERGLKLSGGQKQRLSIARAVLRNKPILILDEATAAVDNETEKLIHSAINNVIQNRTTIIIAHRLTTIRNADKIVVISDGRIAEQGTHDELMKIENGIYSELYR